LHRKSSSSASVSTLDSVGARVIFIERTPDSVEPNRRSTGSFDKFPLVNTASMLLMEIADYVDVLIAVPLLRVDLLHRVVELLKVFNSRTCGLVLGAGAMKLSQFKSITATHLALSSQCVTFILTQLPVLRAHFAAALPLKQHALLTAFDRLADDYQSHANEVYRKLIGIMEELLEGTMRRVLQQPWARQKSDASSAPARSGGDDDAGAVDANVRQLMKQTSSLHRALSDILSSQQRDSIFQQIGLLFAQLLPSAFSKLELNAEPAKTRVALNVTFIINRLRALSIDEKVCGELQSLVRVPMRSVLSSTALAESVNTPPHSRNVSLSQHPSPEPAITTANADEAVHNLVKELAEAGNISAGTDVASVPEVTETTLTANDIASVPEINETTLTTSDIASVSEINETALNTAETAMNANETTLNTTDTAMNAVEPKIDQTVKQT